MNLVPLVECEKKKRPKGIKASSDKNLDDTNAIIVPILNQNGIEMTPIRGVEATRRSLKLIEYKDWSRSDKRMEEEGSGNLQKTFIKRNSKRFLLMQTSVVDDIEYLGLQPYSSIPANVVDSVPEEEREEWWYKWLKINNTYYFIVTRDGRHYILNLYSNKPLKAWGLTYRTSEKRKNRLFLKAEYKDVWKPIKELKREFRQLIKKQYES